MEHIPRIPAWWPGRSGCRSLTLQTCLGTASSLASRRTRRANRLSVGGGSITSALRLPGNARRTVPKLRPHAGMVPLSTISRLIHECDTTHPMSAEAIIALLMCKPCLWQQVGGRPTPLRCGTSLQAFAQSGSIFAEHERILSNLRVKAPSAVESWRQANLFR